MGSYLSLGSLSKFSYLRFSLNDFLEGIDVFGIHISFTGIWIAIALLLGLFVTERLAKKTGQDTEMYLELAIQLVIAGVIGARIVYVFSNLELFLSDRANVFQISDGGMSFIGAVLVGLLVSYVFCIKNKVSWLLVCDTMIPGVLIGQIIVKSIDGVLDFTVLVVVLIAVLAVYKLRKLDGLVVSVYLVLYGGLCVLDDLTRNNALRLADNGYFVVYFLDILVIVFGFLIFIFQIKKYRVFQKERPKDFLIKKKTK